MSRPIGMAHPVDMGDGVTLNQFRPYVDSDDTDYWIDIQGYRIPLTEKQFIALHEARIQLWDKATKYAEERIVRMMNYSSVRAEWVETTSNVLPTYQGVVDFFTAKIKGEHHE